MGVLHAIADTVVDDHMPELRQLFGYPAMLIASSTLVTVVYPGFL